MRIKTETRAHAYCVCHAKTLLKVLDFVRIKGINFERVKKKNSEEFHKFDIRMITFRLLSRRVQLCLGAQIVLNFSFIHCLSESEAVFSAAVSHFGTARIYILIAKT